MSVTQEQVTQADRDLFRDLYLKTHIEADRIRTQRMLDKGAWDNDEPMQTIARHRLQSAPTTEGEGLAQADSDHTRLRYIAEILSRHAQKFPVPGHMEAHADFLRSIARHRLDKYSFQRILKPDVEVYLGKCKQFGTKTRCFDCIYDGTKTPCFKRNGPF